MLADSYLETVIEGSVIMEIKRTMTSSIGKKCLMAISGALLGLFLLAHLAGNSTIFWGRGSFNSYAERLHSMGFLVHVFSGALLLIFMVHVVTGIILFTENYRARPARYAVYKRSAGSSWGSRSMIYTGALILLFLFVHILNFKFSDKIVPGDTVAAILSRPGYAFFYIVSFLALALHISHGFWSMNQTVGLNHPKYNRMLRVSALGLSIIIGAVFILIPSLFLIYGDFFL